MPLYQTFDRAVDTKKFIGFLHKLRKKHGPGRFYLYMDNLSVHKSKRSMSTYSELDIEPIWAPIYSPDYNPIELCFS